MSKTLFIYDIFENIIEYLDPISTLNLIMSCKGTNDIYYLYPKLINKKVIYKIFNYFNLWKCIENKEKNFTEFINCLNLYEINYLKKHSFNIYKYFYNHTDSNIGDFLIYHIENSYSYEPTDFFRYLVSLCDKRIYYQTNYANDMDCLKLSTNDIIYILTYCNLNQFIILLEHFNIKSNLIAYIIKEMLITSKKKIDNNNLINTNEKIYKSLEYFFYKHIFGHKNFNLFLNHIIITLLEYNKNEFIDFILLKRRRYRPNEIELTYQSLIVAAIESNNIQGLQMIWSEYNRDNEYNQIDVFENFVLVITPDTLTKICKNGWFFMLNWVVDNLLQSTINLSGYITAIRNGIFLHEIFINQNPNDNKDCDFSELLFLRNYLTQENKDMINNEISIIYKTNRAICNKKIVKL